MSEPSRYRKTEVTAEGRIIVDPQRILDSPEAQRHLASLRRTNPMTTAADRERAVALVNAAGKDSRCTVWRGQGTLGSALVDRITAEFAVVRAETFAKTKAACERMLDALLADCHCGNLSPSDVMQGIAALTLDDISETALVSPCCHVPVRVAGEGMTHWYECTLCSKAVDPIREVK